MSQDKLKKEKQHIIINNIGGGHYTIFYIVKNDDDSVLIKGANSLGNPDFETFKNHPLIQYLIS